MALELETWVGQTLCGRYRVLGKLGEGGMGAVFRARDEKLQADVVVKVPRRDLLHDPAFVRRFQSEIRSLVELSHPHVVKVTDADIHDGLPFAVMQYLAGGSLDQRRRSGAGGDRLPGNPQDLASWLPQIAAALDFLHRKHYVHRDVKPANILFDEHDNAFLGDFGVAKAMADQQNQGRGATLTGTGLVLGTPEYMAPEAIMGRAIDGRSDQYALAVVAFEMLCGRRPFEAEVPSAVLVMHTSQRPTLPKELAAALPNQTADCLYRGLAKKPEQRFGSCEEFSQALLATLVGVRAASTTSSPRVARGTPGAVSCPVCSHRLNVKEKHAGRAVECPGCHTVLNVSAARDCLTENAAHTAKLAKQRAGEQTTAGKADLSTAPSTAASVQLPALGDSLLDTDSLHAALTPAMSPGLLAAGRKLAKPARRPTPSPLAWAAIGASLATGLLLVVGWMAMSRRDSPAPGSGIVKTVTTSAETTAAPEATAVNATPNPVVEETSAKDGLRKEDSDGSTDPPETEAVAASDDVKDVTTVYAEISRFPLPVPNIGGIASDGNSLFVSTVSGSHEIIQLSFAGNVLERVQAPDESGALNGKGNPTALAWGPDVLFVGDGGNTWVHALNWTNKKTIYSFQTPIIGGKPGDPYRVHVAGLAFDGRYLYAAAANTRQVFVFEPNGAMQRAFPTKRKLDGLAFDGTNLLATSRRHNQILKLSSQGERLETITAPIGGASSLAGIETAGGRVFVAAQTDYSQPGMMIVLAPSSPAGINDARTQPPSTVATASPLTPLTSAQPTVSNTEINSKTSSQQPEPTTKSRYRDVKMVEVARFPLPTPSPGGLASDGANLFVSTIADERRIYALSNSGAVLDYIPAPDDKGAFNGRSNPEGMAYGDGNLILGDSNGLISIVDIGVKRVVGSFRVPKEVGIHKSLQPRVSGIAFDGELIYASGLDWEQIWAFDRSGRFVREFKIPFRASGLAFNGINLVAVDLFKKAVHEITREGEEIAEFSIPASGVGVETVDELVFVLTAPDDGARRNGGGETGQIVVLAPEGTVYENLEFASTSGKRMGRSKRALESKNKGAAASSGNESSSRNRSQQKSQKSPKSRSK